MFSSTKEEATSRAQLVGSIGVVISSRISREFGEIRIKDKSGHDLRVVCKLAPGSSVPKEHESVVVVDYDDKEGLLVAPLEEDAAPPPVKPEVAAEAEDEDDDDDQSGHKRAV